MEAWKANGLKLRRFGRVAEYVRIQVSESGLLALPISRSQIEGVGALPLHHRDPFDRLLASQCITEDLVLISDDQVFDSYGVVRIW
jgi:PIN domain nuclease of toxin-antitoxin system